MRLITTSFCLAVLAAGSTAALAQDKAFPKQLDEKAAQMKRCADMARALEKIPVPAKHAEAKSVEATKAVVSEKAAAAPAAAAPAAPAPAAPAVNPVHKQFEDTVTRMDADFRRCGDELFKDLAKVEAGLRPFIEQAKKSTMSEPEKKAVSGSIGGYMLAKQDLQAAVALLSKDIQMQAYVEKTLTEHYLNQKY